MSLIYWNGLDTYNNLAELTQESAGRVVVGVNDTFSTSSGRYGKCAIRAWASIGYADAQGDMNRFNVLSSGVNDVWRGCAINPNIAGTWSVCSFISANSTGGWTTQNRIFFDYATQKFITYRGANAAVLANSSTGAMSTSAWHWLEVRSKLSGTAGIIEIWVDGVQVLNVTGANTAANASLTQYDVINFSSACGFCDDIYFLDTSGPAPYNTRLGDSRMVSLVPAADASNNNGTPSTGVNHYAVVDELPASTSDYITLSNITGQEEVFTCTGLPQIANTIYSVALHTQVSKTDAVSSANVHNKLVTNTYVSNGASKALTTSYNLYREEWQSSPETSAAWTPTNINNIKIGVVVE